MINKNKTITISIKLKAEGINAINNYVVYGYPSPFTFWGFAHNLALKCNTVLENETILPIVHYYRNRTQGINNTFDNNKSSQYLNPKTKKIATISDMPKGDIQFTILMKFIKNDNQIINEDIIKNHLLKMRFGGGIIVQSSINVKINNNSDEIIKRTSNGFVYIKENITLSEDNPFEDFSNNLIIKKDNGWRIPTLLGYSLIEEPQSNRKGVRFGYKHSFAEPLIGIAKFIKFVKYGDDKMSIENNGWKLEVSKNNIEIINNGDK